MYTGTTVDICMAELLVVARSASFAETAIELVIVPDADGVATIVILEAKADARSPTSQVTVSPTSLQVPCALVAETKVIPFANVSVKVTPVASFGPSLTTVAL